jgi:dihydrofolate reductase
MRDLIVTENITLDGVIDATEGWFHPAGGEDDVSDVETALRKQREAADALLLGRVAFEQMRGYWPLQTDDTTGITDYLNDVSKYVLSTRLQDPEWQRTVVLRSVDDIRALKSETGRDIVTTGSMHEGQPRAPRGQEQPSAVRPRAGNVADRGVVGSRRAGVGPAGGSGVACGGRRRAG